MSEKKKRSKNVNLRVFLLILFLTTAVSILVKLNKNFNYTVDIPVEFVNLSEDKILKSYSKDQVKVSGTASGYDYLKYTFKDQQFTIDLANLKRNQKGLYYYVFDTEKDRLSGSLNQSQVSDFTPDTLFFDLDQNFEKRLPVYPRITLNFSPGYGSLEGLKLNPDTVLVRGPKSSLDTLTRIPTQSVNLNSIKQSKSDSIELLNLGNQIEIIPPRVQYRLLVDKFTEGTITVPIQLINVPPNVTAKIFPKRVELIFNVNFKNYERIKASDFRVVCDFDQIDSTSTSLTPQIEAYPEFIRDVRLREKTVQYLLVK